MSKLKVKPCPFCGSDDISFSAFSISDDAYALCGHCNAGIEIQVGWDEMTEKEHDEVCAMELQKVWNRRFVEQQQLNENQLEVLDWLKNYVSSESVTPIDTVGVFWKERNFMGQPQKWKMNSREQAQVLQAFSQWALEQGEADERS